MSAGDRRGVRFESPVTVGELTSRWGGKVDAESESRRVARVVAPEDASDDDDLIVLTSARHLGEASRASGVVLCLETLAERLADGGRWAHPHVMWVVANILSGVTPRTAVERPTAHVAPGARVATDASVRTGAVVLDGATIGAGSVIGENAVIYGGVTIARNVIVGPGAVVGRPGFGWASGPDGEVLRVPHLGGVEIADDVEIGPLCSVDAGTLRPTRIERGVKLDAQVHVGHNVRIGAGTLVAAQSGFAGSAVLGEGVLVGGQAGVTDHARVGDGAKIAAKSGVIGDIPSGAVVAGFPAVGRGRWLRAMAILLGGKKSDD